MFIPYYRFVHPLALKISRPLMDITIPPTIRQQWHRAYSKTLVRQNM
jgi:hypothetical protein